MGGMRNMTWVQRRKWVSPARTESGLLVVAAGGAAAGPADARIASSLVIALSIADAMACCCLVQKWVDGNCRGCCLLVGVMHSILYRYSACWSLTEDAKVE